MNINRFDIRFFSGCMVFFYVMAGVYLVLWSLNYGWAGLLLYFFCAGLGLLCQIQYAKEIIK